jgi:hypothetical protein
MMMVSEPRSYSRTRLLAWLLPVALWYRFGKWRGTLPVSTLSHVYSLPFSGGGVSHQSGVSIGVLFEVLHQLLHSNVVGTLEY